MSESTEAARGSKNPTVPSMTAMSPERLAECMGVLSGFQWSRRGLARTLGYSSGTTLRDKLAGKVRVTQEEADWIERWFAFAQENPAPAMMGSAHRAAIEQEQDVSDPEPEDAPEPEPEPAAPEKPKRGRKAKVD